MEILTPDLSERKRILNKVSHNHPQWKGRIAAYVVLMLIAAAIICYTAVLLISNPTSAFGVFIFLCAAICIACVPFFIALSVKNTAKYKCALPYTSYANGSLLLYDDRLEYAFWRVGPREPAAYSSKRAVYNDEDKFVYSISKKDIKSIVFNDEICVVKGNGTTQMPEWAEEDATVKRVFKEFSFILAFEQKNSAQIIDEWWKGLADRGEQIQAEGGK